ncbi:Rhamnogalacturonyl hydrolase YesR [Lutibacter agarilyticus]|uniref:Rhamnogalacturonyl hydrolase YesR n=2 Tax=Lutibacter agarilyticus TaxID=1109740 RepID=A0A238VA52_9FLAO|nr:Rhamnogalacturonyl hydrolase YesR [Lutibacter agarilyticus]
MKNLLVLIVLIGNLFSMQAQSINPILVRNEMQRVADWQIEHFRDTYSGRKKPHHIADWTNGALYVGMVKYAKMAKDDRYWKWLKEIGEQQNWKLHWRKYMADDHTIGQMYLELYRKYGDSAMMKPTIKSFEYIINNPSKEPITLDKYKHLERWTWCDALFMAPPVLAKLGKETGDKKYTDFMMKEYKATRDHLFDAEENLFYRDNSYIGKLDDGNKIFWARGNGWVFGGLTLLMDEYEPGSKEYEYFKDIYLKMAKKIIEIQTPEGHWAMSLLGQKKYPTPETSGTSFFTFGLAWGINNGLLDAKTYQPHVEKAWNCLTSHITKEGMLGYVQPIGAAPGKAWADKTEVYGSGAFLAAGSEVYKMVGGQPIFQLSEPNYKKSPKTGMTRKHWKEAALYMLDGAFSYVNSNDDALKFPKIGTVGYPKWDSQIPVEKLEGLSRTLFVAAPLLKENPNLKINGIDIAAYYRQNILNLIDEEHPSFIKDKVGNWPGQTLVEFGALSMSMFMIPEVLWDPLTKTQKDVLAKKMISYADGPTVPSNWKFFNIFVLSFFKDQGYQVNETLLVDYLNKSLEHYRGDGWYNDNPAYDYYSMWAFQMYGPVWNELFGNKYYPEIAKKFKENFLPVAENYPYMFSENGEMIMWGRSITYRLASVSPFPLLGFYEDDLQDANWGGFRRTASGVLLQFLQHPEFMKDNVPTLGFYGAFDPSTQPYSCRGSVFWMAKSFLSLLSPEGSKFWNEEENNGVWENELKNTTITNRFYEGSEIMVTNYKNIGASEIRAWCNVPRAGIKEPFRSSENYNKLSYNSAFPWQADNTAGTASMNYVFKTNNAEYPFESGHIYDFIKFEDNAYYRKLTSEYIDNVAIQLADIPLENGILRVDKIEADKEVSISLGHYSLAHINGFISKKERTINGKEVHIIDNGKYQLALVPVIGWNEIKTITSNNIHPETKESTVINVVDIYNPLEKNNIYVTAMLWKKSGIDFTDKELNIVKKVNVKKDKIRLYFTDKSKKEIKF